MLTFRSTQSQIAIWLCGISIIIAVYNKFGIMETLVQASAFFFIARNVECLVYGKCYMASWIATLIPLTIIILTIAYQLDYFDKYRIRIENIVNKLEHINNSKLHIINNINSSNIKNKS